MDEILSHGGDLTIGDKHGHTPLHLMVQHGATFDNFKWILEKGSDLKIKDKYGMTVADMIKRKKKGNPERWQPFLDLV